MRERGLRGGQGGLAGVNAGHVPEKDPRLSLLAWIQHVVQSGRELQDGGRRSKQLYSTNQIQTGTKVTRLHNELTET